MTRAAVWTKEPGRRGFERMRQAAAGVLLALGALAVTGVAADAATVQWSVTGDWIDSDGGDRVAGVGSDTLSWGGISQGRRSAYIFDGRSPSAEVPVPSTQEFLLGTFTHRNRPIPSGSGIDRAKLRVNARINIGGTDVDLSPAEFDFDFNHLETDNRANPCANGAPNRTGINSNGCADRVDILSTASLSQTVLVDNVSYLVKLSGFFDQGNPVGTFWTREKADNVAELRGEVTAVPLPAAGLLLLGGLGLLAARRRR